MSGAFPTWMQRLLGLPAEEAGQGTVWTLSHDWRWAPWVTVLAVLAATLWVGWLYLHERGTASRRVRLLLTALRLGTLGILLMMLAGWVLSVQRTGLPYLVIALDDSASMAVVDRYPESALQHAAATAIRELGQRETSRLNVAKSVLLGDDREVFSAIERRYKLRYYLLSDEARAASPPEADAWLQQLEAAGPASRLGAGVRSILNDFRGNPPAAVIVLTDGVTTAGESLSEVARYARQRGVPLVTVGIGNERPPRDARLTDVLVDEVAFAGDVLPFEVTVSASGMTGEKTRLVLRRKNEKQILAEAPVTLGPDGQPQRVLLPYRIEANENTPESVEVEFVVELESLAREQNVANNRAERRVRILKQQLRVLLVQAYPSYEFRYLREMLRRDESILLHTVLQEADAEYAEFEQAQVARPVVPVSREEIFQYDVILFGDVNPSSLSASVMQHLRDFVLVRGGGLVFIAGPRYTPLAYQGTPLEPLLPIELSSARLPPAEDATGAGFVARPTDLGLMSPPLQIGESVEDTANRWRGLAPLYWLLEAPDLKPAARVLVEHPTKTDARGRNLPLIALQYVGAGKVVFHATDETWRWRKYVGDSYFARYWVQMIRFLSRGKLGQQRGAQLTADRRDYRQGDTVRLRLRYLDEQFAPGADDGVTLRVESSGRSKQQLVLQRSGAARGVFEGTLAGLREGEYRAWVVEPASSAETSVNFLVQPPPGETERLQMDAAELQRAARESRGKYYRWDQASRLIDELPRGRQVPIDSLPPRPLWNKWPLLVMFLGLLAGEWMLRKRHGML